MRHQVSSHLRRNIETEEKGSEEESLYLVFVRIGALPTGTNWILVFGGGVAVGVAIIHSKPGGRDG